jgi:hypothetical protein
VKLLSAYSSIETCSIYNCMTGIMGRVSYADCAVSCSSRVRRDNRPRPLIFGFFIHIQPLNPQKMNKSSTFITVPNQSI